MLATNRWIAVGLALLAMPAAAADLARGEMLYAACAACHSGEADALGPSLEGIVGRKAGALEDFRYSPAMQRADFVWSEKNLAAYLRDPQALVKGNRMPFSGLSSDADIADLIAYLATLR